MTACEKITQFIAENPDLEDDDFHRFAAHELGMSPHDAEAIVYQITNKLIQQQLTSKQQQTSCNQTLSLTQQELMKMLQDPYFIIIDVRTTQEFNQGHLPKAILLETPLPPLNTQQICYLAQSLQNLLLTLPGDQNTPLGFYCKKGKRANLAVAMARNMGYMNSYLLGGVELSPLLYCLTQQ